LTAIFSNFSNNIYYFPAIFQLQKLGKLEEKWRKNAPISHLGINRFPHSNAVFVPVNIADDSFFSFQFIYLEFFVITAVQEFSGGWADKKNEPNVEMPDSLVTRGSRVPG
jgi:hypothetical protein